MEEKLPNLVSFLKERRETSKPLNIISTTFQMRSVSTIWKNNKIQLPGKEKHKKKITRISKWFHSGAVFVLLWWQIKKEKLEPDLWPVTGSEVAPVCVRTPSDDFLYNLTIIFMSGHCLTPKSGKMRTSACLPMPYGRQWGRAHLIKSG